MRIDENDDDDDDDDDDDNEDLVKARVMFGPQGQIFDPVSSLSDLFTNPRPPHFCHPCSPPSEMIYDLFELR